MSNHRSGDTLIEVLFAFAIFSVVISVMFSGALSSYKSALSAQDRSTALFVAQYQADGLKTYRDSLAWNGPGYSFLGGDSINSPVKISAIPSTGPFCMKLSDNVDSPASYWFVQTNVNTDCNGDSGVAKSLAPSLNSPQISIIPSPDPSSDTEKRAFKIEVSWIARNSGQREKVENTILLTRQR